MKRHQWQSRFGAAMLAFVLMLGVGMILNTAQAQNQNDRDGQNRRDRDGDRYGNYGGSTELRQAALNAGYNEGVREGNNRQNGSQSNYQDSNAYRRATSGYYSRLGDRELYRRYFREAFAIGYNSNGNDQRNAGRDDRGRNRDGNDNGNQNRRGRNWDQYGNYGGSFQLRQTALNAGYNEGIKQGRSDRNRRNRSDYRNNSAYRRATKDYNNKDGDRELYQRYYRDAYANGYDAGINGN